MLLGSIHITISRTPSVQFSAARNFDSKACIVAVNTKYRPLEKPLHQVTVERRTPLSRFIIRLFTPDEVKSEFINTGIFRPHDIRERAQTGLYRPNIDNAM